MRGIVKQLGRLLGIAAVALFAATASAFADDAKQAAIAALLESDAPPPDGFVRQKLDVSDGLIFMPKGWFYRNSGTPSGWMWTFSLEDSQTTPYQTGMRIQMFVGLSKNGAPTGAALAQSILQQLRAAAVSVVSTCDPAPVGKFTRQCLETIETSQESPGVQFHIQYAAFWTDDMVVMTTFGTPVGKWNEMRPIGETMAAFRMFGPNVGK